jgi:hypothetical protein
MVCMTRRWREMDSNRRSPVRWAAVSLSGTAGASAPPAGPIAAGSGALPRCRRAITVHDNRTMWREIVLELGAWAMASN